MAWPISDSEVRMKIKVNATGIKKSKHGAAWIVPQPAHVLYVILVQLLMCTYYDFTGKL